MKRTIIVALVISLLLVILPVSLALAQGDTDTVTVTATPGQVSISTSGIYDFGLVGESSTPDTSGSPLIITNGSSLVIDISIGCNGWSGTTTWTYGAAGADTALLNAGASDGGTGGSQGATLFDIEIPDTGSILLVDDLPTTTTGVTWNLQLEAPTSFSLYDEQTTTVTLTTTVGG